MFAKSDLTALDSIAHAETLSRRERNRIRVFDKTNPAHLWLFLNKTPKSRIANENHSKLNYRVALR